MNKPTETPENSPVSEATAQEVPVETHVSSPKPTPRPGPRPARPLPRPATTNESDIRPPVDEEAEKKARSFGRVDTDGTVYVQDTDGERSVGQFPGVSSDEAMSLYVRRYLDLVAKASLFEARLTSTDLTTKEIESTLSKLKEETEAPAAVGNLSALRESVQKLVEIAQQRQEQIERERIAAKEASTAERIKIVEAAEKIASTDPSKIQWRPAGEELRQLLDQWKEAQRHGPRIDRTQEDSLWKRFSHARTTFDRERRHFFAELEQRNTEAKNLKERLVAEAEDLASNVDWGATSSRFRDLMAQWKSAGRAARRDDDALWARFRAAQDAFFAARDAANAATDAEYAANLAQKEELLTQAEALLPVKDIAPAKAALRSIHERWEEIGRVPRGDVQRIEGRLRAIESAVREAEQAQWKRSNPETRARAEGAAAQLEAAIADLEAKLSAAHQSGATREAEDLSAALAARRSWLEQVLRAAEDSRG